MAAPLVWVATELGRTYVLTGFPWVLLGYSQTTVLPVAQFASVFGVYGVSMLVAAMSAALAVVAAGRAERGATACRSTSHAGTRFGGPNVRPARHRLRDPDCRVGVGLRAGWPRASGRASGEPIRVGLIQGNVDQAEKMGAARAPVRSSRTTSR